MGLFKNFGKPNVEKMKAKKDVRGLIKVLEEYQKGISEAAALALGEIGGKPAEDALVKKLTDPFPTSSKEFRSAAAIALGKIGDAQTAKSLIESYTLARSGRSEILRESILQGLAALGAQAVVPLIASLKSASIDYASQTLAVEALGRIADPRAVEPLIASLKSNSTNYLVRISTAEALGKIGDGRAAEPLISLFGYVLDNMRETAFAAVLSIGAPAVGPLIAALSQRNTKVRNNAAQALARIGDPRTVEPLIASLKSNSIDYASQIVVVEALGKIGDARAAESLISLFGGGVDEMRETAFAAVISIGAPAVEPLIAALSHKKVMVRNIAAQALGRIADPRAVEPLIAALADKDEKVPQMAAKALGWIADPRAVEPLMQALKNKNLLARQPAAEALGLIRDPRAVHALVDALKVGFPRGNTPKNIEDFYWSVYIMKQDHLMRQEAAGALIAIGDASVDPLIAVLQDEDLKVRGFAAAALGEIGEKRAIKALIPLQQDGEDMVRQASAEALKKLGWQGAPA
jgi:HEAT repeat protein